ncbi:MAG: GNAT family N-acetyltransferase [Candidatus Competibacteraceae bacterium]
MHVVLESEHLCLCELGPSDLSFTTILLGDPVVMRYWPRPYTREEALEWLRQQQVGYSRDGYGYWLAVEKVSGRPIGQVGLLRQEVESYMDVSLGYILHHPFWRRGFATEAAAACLKYAFTQLDRSRVIALMRPENLPSQGVARKLGMVQKRLILYKGLPHLLYVAERPLDSTAAEPNAHDSNASS